MKIAIASGKGGTGKTTLATNLASYLAEERAVVLADLDVEEPNAALFLNGSPVREELVCKFIPEWTGACSFCGVCQSVCNFHAVLELGTEILVFPELCHSCHACSELCPEAALKMIPARTGVLRHFTDAQLTFVESRMDIGQEQAVPLIRQAYRYIDAHFPPDMTVILDAPPGTSCPAVAAVKQADYVILVTEPTPFGLNDLRLAVAALSELNKPCGVVINRDGIGNDKVADYCRENKIAILARIPNDRRIAEKYARGELSCKDMPVVREQLQQIVRAIPDLQHKMLSYA